jgi:hypothetical protein
MFSLLFLLLDIGPAPVTTAPVQTHDLSRMTWRQAQFLSGQPVRVVFTVDSLDGEYKGCVLVDAEALPGNSVTIRFARGPAACGAADGRAVRGRRAGCGAGLLRPLDRRRAVHGGEEPGDSGGAVLRGGGSVVAIYI